MEGHTEERSDFPKEAKHLISKGERLGAFSDAVFSIVATIMIIPLKLTKTDQENFSYEYPYGEFILRDWLANGTFYVKFSTYLFSYFAVVHFWYSHNKLFRLIEHFDDILVWLNLVYLLFVSFLPAAMVLIQYFPFSSIALAICAGNIILVNTTMIASLFVAFRQKHLLHPDLVEHHGIRRLKLLAYLPLAISIATGLLAILLSFSIRSTPEVGLYFLIFMSFTPLLVQLMISLLYRIVTKDWISFRLRDAIVKSVVSKERLIAFSDGVFAIVGTLLILDVTTGQITGSYSHSEQPIKAFLSEKKYELLSIFGAFLIVGLLWFVHHSMFEYFRVSTAWLTTFNSISLLFVGLIPFGAGLVSEFSEGSNTANEVTSIQAFGVLLVFASTSQLLVWTVAHCQRRKCLTEDVSKKSVEAVVLSKLLIFPIVGFLIYAVSFFENIGVHNFFSILAFVTPVLFILPRFVITVKDLYENYKNRKDHMIVPTSIHRHEDNKQQDVTEDSGLLQNETSMQEMNKVKDTTTNEEDSNIN